MVVIFPKAYEAEKTEWKNDQRRCLSHSIIINQRDYTLGMGVGCRKYLLYNVMGLWILEFVFILPLGSFALVYNVFAFCNTNWFFRLFVLIFIDSRR